ncbi:hypothetical protein [Lunatimonas salinarum]|uniref:hypothetical protein n=1 Tax=Lunatimonas salinarum TaxID=1774590 RepID=UPI001AE08BEF|nr:hypothetical protein [Lunatimonas salinarum]
MTKKIERHLIILLAALGVGCNSDEGIRLQTDQSFEGEEMYMVSKILDEHLPFIIQRPTFFLQQDPDLHLPDCPTISVDEQTGDIALIFEENACETTSNNRIGNVLIRYSNVPLTTGDSVIVSFENYRFENHQVLGTRILRLVGLNRERRVFEESSEDLLIVTPKNHSTRVAANFTFEIIESEGTIARVRSHGTASGRNRGGMPFEAEVLETKVFENPCINRPLLRPVSGVEVWEIERNPASKIVHRQTFHHEGDCVTHTLIRLDEGVEMKKTP